MTDEQKRYLECCKMLAEGIKNGLTSEPDAEQVKRIRKRIDEMLKGIPPCLKVEKD